MPVPCGAPARLLLLLATAATLGAAAPAPDTRRAQASIDAVSHAFDDAQFRKDRATLDRLLAPDMVYISGGGRIAGRDAFMAVFSNPADRYDPFIIKDRRLVRLGTDVIAVTADGAIRGTNASGRFAEHFQYTDIFRRRAGRWEVAFVQVTRKPEP